MGYMEAGADKPFTTDKNVSLIFLATKLCLLFQIIVKFKTPSILKVILYCIVPGIIYRIYLIEYTFYHLIDFWVLATKFLSVLTDVLSF